MSWTRRSWTRRAFCGLFLLLGMSAALCTGSMVNASARKMSQRSGGSGGANLSFVLSGIGGAEVCTKRRPDVVSHTRTTHDVEGGSDEYNKKNLPVLYSSRRTVVVCFVCCCCLIASLIGIGMAMTITFPDAPLALLRAPPHARNESVTERAKIGLWDSQRAITKLQLQVAVSLALGVRSLDDDIHVTERESHFFTVVVDHTDNEEVSFMKGPRFLNLLNNHLSPFGGVCVVSNDVVKLV